MKLSRNFSLEEFAVSKDHPELASLISFTEADRIKAKMLVELYLQPIRSMYGKPVVILSGKRSPALNTAVGGSITSDHRFENFAAACDFTVPGVNMRSIYDFMKSNMPYYQLILYPKSNFIHVSLPDSQRGKRAWITTES